MRARSRLDTSDSLELLLDTICNVFGGIIFIAILVTILTSHQSQAIRSTADAARTALAGDRDARIVTAEIASFKSSLTELAKMDQTLGIDSTRRTAEVLELIEKRQLDAQERSDRARRWLKEYEELVKEKFSEIDQRFNDAKNQVSVLEKTAAEVSRSKTIQGRLPFERQTTKSQVILFLVGNKAYIVPLSRSAPLLTSHHLDRDVETENHGESMVVKIAAGRGFAVHADVDREPKLQALLSLLHPAQHFVDLFVSDDSAASFRYLRDALVNRGFSYNVSPVSDHAGILALGRGIRGVQ